MDASLDDLDDRKTASLAGWSAQPDIVEDSSGALHIHRHAIARQVMRGSVEQNGFGADMVRRTASIMRLPVLFLDGEQHAELRRATARFFAPRTVEESYLELMQRETDRLVGDFARQKEARLDLIAMDMSVTVAAEIAGLTEHLGPGMPSRIAGFLKNPPVNVPMSPKLIWRIIKSQTKLAIFYLFDVRPSIQSRRKAPRQDLISHLLSIGYRDREILTECVLFGAAGMVTTREFISIAAMHLIERPELSARFIAAGNPERRAILEEILRLEPVLGKLYRRATEAMELSNGRRVEAGQAFVIDIRSVNGDESAVGGCPHHLDPDRGIADPKIGNAAMAFGDGRHRCPGAYIAMEESAIFLGKLLALPNLRMFGTPDIGWSNLVGGYEFHEARIACD
jgi:cytochrome P450